jgi:hypothetical protein
MTLLQWLQLVAEILVILGIPYLAYILNKLGKGSHDKAAK